MPHLKQPACSSQFGAVHAGEAEEAHPAGDPLASPLVVFVQQPSLKT